jgi:hypothetical protein
MVEYCDTPETERREQTGNTKHTYTLEASSLLDREPHILLCSETMRLNSSIVSSYQENNSSKGRSLCGTSALASVVDQSCFGQP